MTEAVNPRFPGVSLFWELTPGNVLTIAMRAPMEYAKKFRLPGDMLYQFLMAIQAQGVGLQSTETVHVRFDTKQRSFLIRWSGEVMDNPELVHEVLPTLTAKLGIEAHGE